jgi:PAS domain S-box-containing protein
MNFRHSFYPVTDAAGAVTSVVSFSRDITESRKAEERMRHLASFPLLNPTVIMELDSAGNVVYSNPYSDRISREAGLEGPQGILPADMAVVFRELEERQGSTASREVAIGDRTFQLGIFRPRGLELYRVHGLDITERKRAQDSLSETRDYLEKLINYANAPIIVWSPDSSITRFNGAFEKLSGYKAGEVIGRKLEILFPDDSKEASLAEIKRTAMGGQLETIEIPILRKDGSKRVALWNSANIYDKDGRTVISTIAQGQDITERKQAGEQVLRLAEAVQAEKDRLSALVNSITDEIWFADTGGRFVLANPKALEEFGMASSPGRDIAEMAASLEVLRPDGSPRPVEEAPPLRALKGEVVTAEEELVRTPGSGEFRRRQVSSAPVRDAAGNIIGSVSVVRDITDRRRAELALQKARERNSQQEKLAAIGRLAGGVAHELRNPLAAMKNAAYYLGMAADGSDPSVAETIAVLNREIARSDSIISSLLGLARPAQPSRTEIDVSAVLESTLGTLRLPAGVALETRLDEALPPVAADAGQLSIVFGNLMRNACEAMPGGGRLSVASSAEGGRVTVTIADTGSGMPPEVLSRLFEPLFSTKQGGTGLGLSVAKMLVEGSGGTIEAQSEAGKGSTFTIRLPAKWRAEG